jgi:CO/xanthine dehydrogenase FAD-binding subunit
VSMPALLRPSDLAAALHAGAARSSAYIAGGTALQLQWLDLPQPAALVDLVAIADRSLALDGSTLRIGAGVTLERCRSDALVRTAAPLLALACETIGAYSVRNLATLGGNIGWRLGDTLPALLASAASVELADGRRLALVDLLDQTPLATPLPLLVAVHLPAPAARAAWFFEKVGHRAAFSPTVVAACGMLALDAQGTIRDAALAVSAAGVPAFMLVAATAALRGGSASDAGWHADFERALADELAAATSLAAHPRGVLRRLLAGRLYQSLESA